MKRFLSLLLSAMLLLGSLSVTALASSDTIDFALDNGSGRTQLGVKYNSAQAGTYVMFTAVEGATYKNGASAAEVGPVMKEGTVSLKVNAGINNFTAEKGGAVSNVVTIYGTAFNEISQSGHTLGIGDITDAGVGLADGTNGHVANLYASIAAYEEAKASGATIPDDLQENYNLAKKVFEYDETTKVAARAPYDSKDFSTVAVAAGKSTGGGAFAITYSNTVDAGWYGYDFYVDGDLRKPDGTTVNTRQLARFTSPASLTYVYLKNDGTIYGTGNLSQIDGVAVTKNEWHSIGFYSDSVTKLMDIYLDGVLIAKAVNPWGVEEDTIAKVTFYGITQEARVDMYYANRFYDSTLKYTKVPSLAATFDDANDTITVTGTDLEDYAGYQAKIFVNGMPTVDTVTLGSATPVRVDTAVENATVYAALVDAKGNIVSAIAPIKSNEGTMTLPESDIIAPLPLALNGTDLRDFEMTPSAEAGSKVLFDVITPKSGTVKYFHNGAEVTDLTSPVAGTVALPVVAGDNVYTAKRYDEVGQVMEAATSAPVHVEGIELAEKTSNVYNSRSIAVEDEAVLATLGRENAYVSTIRSNLTSSGQTQTIFTEDGGKYEYAAYETDVYYNLAGDKINGDTGYASIMGAANSSSSSSFRHLVVITDDCSLKIGLAQGAGISESNMADTGIDIAQGQWNTFKLCVKNNGKLDLYVNGVLVVRDHKSASAAADLYSEGCVFTSGHPLSHIYYSGNFGKFTLNRFGVKYYAETGDVEIPKSVIEAAKQSSNITVLGLKADGTVQASAFTFGSGETVKTVNLGTGFDKVFVWNLGELYPLCAPAFPQ